MVAVPHDPNQVLITLQLLSRSAKLIRSMNFNVVDSAEARLCRGQHEQDGVDLPHQLAEKTKVDIPLAFSLDNTITAHQLRGTLTYVVQVVLKNVSQ